MSTARRGHLKIGELARRAGVSVRTLHHYDEIGLLRPALGGGGEARLYGPAEVRRLAHIRSLQGLGLSLAQVRAALDDPGSSLLPTLEAQLASVTAEIEAARELRKRLEHLASALRDGREPSVEEFLRTMEAMSMFEKYYTKDQLDYLAQRAEDVGPERMQEVQGEWNRLFAAFRAARERGDDPASPAVQELARKARSLVEEFSDGDAGMERSLGNLYANEPAARDFAGTEAELWEYMGRARRALGGDAGAPPA